MVELTKEQADFLLNCPKEVISSNDLAFPNSQNKKLNIPLRSTDGLYDFLLDINRNQISIYKATYQNRYNRSVVLARLDLNGAGHRNPYGHEVSGSHLHLYSQEYGDKVAIELPECFNNINPKNLPDMLLAFMEFCNIIKKPNFVYNLETGDIFNEYHN